ncbi:putative ABC bile acid transporter [Aspergillus saccharolyticus JOP 1030-1]|uniref:ABC transporter n=1 Tax=Aspergillus saccharolyticus JOP 1030-1 TaxID=1450539 RepID=A0A318ZDQ3_9EURO|nr:hypothetical protein BP01DRAFT_327097 [Aspergillus saccharolyticus JOP 1030-1]PYH41660.1 hypothetical protein BP01DRAFT_327097 [Aspergillus saccharolyticus JOP 1030-1]
MDDTIAEPIVNRDEPIPVIFSDKQKHGTKHSRPGGHKRSVSSVGRSLQDRLFSKILEQVVPTEDADKELWSGGDKTFAADPKRPAFSLPVMANNFRRFNARIGIVFTFQIQVERLFSWKKASHTLSFLFIYSFICLNPHLFVLVPISVILFFIMVPAFLARHPPPPSTSTSSITPYYSYDGPALAPAKTIKPASETSKDFFRNMRDLQNCMADFSDAHDAMVSAFAPVTNFSDEKLSSAVFLFCLLVAALLFLTAHLVPWRLVFLVGGDLAVLSLHPGFQDFFQAITADLTQQPSDPGSMAEKQLRSAATAAGIPLPASSTSAMSLVGSLANICLDSDTEEREVEIFEIQYRSLAPYSESQWDHFLFSPMPYDPLSPLRIAGDRPKGCRFFEDVQPPSGWAWKSKKWELDLDCREWVVERMITGVGFEVPGSASEDQAANGEIGGWVWDLPPAFVTNDSAVAPGLETDAFHDHSHDGKGSLRKKGKERASQDYEERGTTGKMGEWRRRRWIRIVHRTSIPKIDSRHLAVPNKFSNRTVAFLPFRPPNTRGCYLPSLLQTQRVKLLSLVGSNPMLIDMKDGASNSCHWLWDSPNARPSLCALEYLSLAPAAVILIIALNHVLSHGPLTKRPKWTIPFVQEEPASIELPIERPQQRVAWVAALFAISLVGFLADLTSVILSGSAISIALPVSWALAATVIAVVRPRSCPASLLAFFTIALVVESAYLINNDVYPVSRLFTRHVAAAAALVGSMVILAMPFRSHRLTQDDISKVGQLPSSDFRSPEDNLRLWQFLSVSWMAPLISMGKKKQLQEEDVWFLGYEFQHRRLHEKFRQLRGSVLGRLLQANGIDVLIITSISIVQMLCDFSTPVLLQQLLQAMKDRGTSNRPALTYALLSLVLRLVLAQAQVLNLWYGRRAYERSRGEMILMVYEKALSRKNVFDQEIISDKENDTGSTEESGERGPDCKQTRWWWPFLRSQKLMPKERIKKTASMGKIFNLLRGDVYEVAQRFWEIDSLIDKPLGLVIATVLVWKLLGPSCFLGVIAILVAQTLNAFITRTLLRWERVRRLATDARLQISSQFVEALRHLRWYGWQNHWLHQVMDARQSELKLRIVTSLWNVLIRFINTLASGLFPVVALYAYTFLAGNPLRIDIIFPALQLFTMLETRLRDIPSLITVLINASIAMERIEDFMAEPDKEKTRSSEDRASVIKLESCTLAWPGRTSPVLSNVNLNVPQGLTVVHGKVGSGKTALLQALLGELDRLEGESYIPNETVGFCGQTPWLQSMSIRDNILFSSPFDEQRYKLVLDACALIPDLSNFKHGDLSFVGENGIGLSGGQKARVALARAMYSSARVLLLDDPLSALDHNTAETVVEKCFQGPLMRDRTVVLVTHRTHLVGHIADQIVHVENGRVAVEVKQHGSSDSKEDQETTPSGTAETPIEGGVAPEDATAAIPTKFIEEEHRAEWGVQARVYWKYIQAGKYRWWLALSVVLTIYRLSSVGQSWFLKEWGEAYKQMLLFFEHSNLNHVSSYSELTTTSAMANDINWSPRDPFGSFPAPDENVKPWLLAFLIITSFQSLMLLLAQLLMLVIVYCAGRTLFQEVMVRVSNATFRFFDVTPVGRLMNRLTSDIGVVDGNISEQFQMIAFQAITWVSSIAVIATVTPTFLGFSLLLTAAFVLIFQRFLPTSQSLRRLEMVSLSPLISNFGELLHGLTTVRAFHAEDRFQNRVIAVVDKFQGMDHFYWSLQSWLMYRFESLSAVSTFCLTVLALYTSVSPGLAAFVLIAANNFVTSTHALCKQYGQLQMDFVSVERVDELLHVEQEPAGTIDPPASWPKFGQDIVFEDVTIRYAPHLDPSLRNITLRIPGGSTTAIIGRTGSGKSTLAVAMLSVVRPESGRILVDGLDITQVTIQALRSRVTFVAQDPVLFPGDIRLNIDPTGEYSDTECAEVLKRVCSRHGWTLETQVEAGGRNLSQGERQLIGLTRAVLRRSPIVILDEATASIDHESSLEIQQILREEMKESTVVTIAHRLEAIKDAEYYIVLDKGGVAEQGFVQNM